MNAEVVTSDKKTNMKWLIKTIVYIILYFIITQPLYLLISEIHIQPPTTLFTPIDYMIPFVSFFVIFYVFLFYPFVIFTIGYFAFIRPEKFDKVFLSVILVYIVAYTTYIIFPVMMIRPDPASLPPDFLSQMMAYYYTKDPPLNCFPSLHAANSTLSAYWLSREKPKYKIGFWTAAFLVILSTLFVRQHVIVDEIYGFLLAYFAAWFADYKAENIPWLSFVKEKEPITEFMTARIVIMLVLASLISVLIVYSYIP